MKVLLINGSPNEKGCTYTGLKEMEKVFSQNGVETEIVYLGKKAVAGCIGCGHCKKTGRCFNDDEVNRVGEKLDSIDGIVVGSPVYFAGPSAQVTAFLDRLFVAYGKKMAGKLGTSIVSCRRGGASSSFDRLNKYFSISNMPIVTSQYWNQIHGNTPEEVMKDEEGLQTLRTLVQNFSWLLKCIEAGKKVGVERGEYESPIKTNFIR